MHAAMMLRSKQRIHTKKMKKLHNMRGGDIPSNVATKEIPPFPQFPPESYDPRDRRMGRRAGRRRRRRV
jgi:hypothetical protein